MILDNFNQWLVANTLYLEMIQLLNQKGGSKEIRELDQYWKSRPVFSNSNMELKFEFGPVNQDNSQSWVRISYGTIKYVVDSNQDNTEIPVDPQEDQVPQTSTSVVARSQAKAKPQPRELAGTTTTIPIHRRRWNDIEPSKQNLASYDLSKKVINLLRHNQKLQREDDGAMEFYRIKFYLRNHHSQIQNWSDDRWKACLAAGG